MIEPSLAWCLAVSAMERANMVVGMPPGLSKARAGGWRLTYNNCSETSAAEKLGAFSINGRHETSAAFFVVGPFGGSTAGIGEAKLLADLMRFVAPEAAEFYADDLKAFEETRKIRR